ncbi:MAG: hypothetical protein EXR92_03465 [Gemmatimonadetes bacterium]|nr:hypothetical protein [Gemmatimonadota bacterium]
MMGKVTILLLLCLGAGLYFPRSREIILDYAQPLLDPILGWQSNQELARFAEDLDIAQESRGTLPDGRGEFDPWMNKRYRREPSRFDGWGSRYTFRIQGDSFFVSSPGQDGVPQTPDDLIEGRALTARARRR